MSIETTKASELHPANTASSTRPPSARDPIHDLVDRLQRAQDLVARVDSALGASIQAVAAQVDLPGRVDDPMFRTRVAYALQDVEKLVGPLGAARMPDGLRQEMTALAATSPGLRNERMQALLQGTATIDDRALVRLIRRTAALVARAADQTSADLQGRIEGLENQARPGTRAEPVAMAPAAPAPPIAPTPSVAATTTPREAQASAAGPVAQPESVVEPPAAPQPTAEQPHSIRGLGATFAIMAALRKPEPATPAPWDQQLTPLKGRVACYIARTQANEEEASVRAAEQSGQAALQALQAFAHGPGAGIMGKIQAAGAADLDSVAGVVSGMREGGRYAGLRRMFNADLLWERALAGALDRASAAVSQYGADRARVHAIAEARGDTAAIAARFAKLDVEVGTARVRDAGPQERHKPDGGAGREGGRARQQGHRGGQGGVPAHHGAMKEQVVCATPGEDRGAINQEPSMRPVQSRRRPAAAAALAVLWVATPASADPTPQTMNGVPLLPIPAFEEVGMPAFTMPTGTPSIPPQLPEPSGTNTNNPADGSDSAAMASMMSRSWGEAAAQNAEAVGVTAVSVAAACTLESNCTANPGGTGTISGAFQMTDSSFTASLNAALARDPNLAATIVPGLAGKLDPATQSIAAAEYLRQGAEYLQAHDVPNPSVLDVRGFYNFGPGNAAAIAGAADSDVMSYQVEGLTAAQFRANGITPGVTTVGEWRASVTSRIGASAANSPVILTRS